MGSDIPTLWGSLRLEFWPENYSEVFSSLHLLHYFAWLVNKFTIDPKVPLLPAKIRCAMGCSELFDPAWNFSPRHHVKSARPASEPMVTAALHSGLKRRGKSLPPSPAYVFLASCTITNLHFILSIYRSQYPTILLS